MIQKQRSENLKDSDFNLKRQREKILDITVSEDKEVPRKKSNRQQTKIHIAKTVSTLAEQVQMLVEENRAKNGSAGGQAKNENGTEAEAKALAASHSHLRGKPHNSCYHPTDPFKERERKPTRSAKVFDKLGDKANSYQMKPHLFERRKLGQFQRTTRMYQTILMTMKVMVLLDHLN
ncbi:Uncharacterized protein Fot_29847 [Forsythia ovata]|uniref:Shugoshin C-terminal domain-containing protein n=1 Tax=Forsythia ovata TaxID=205694 RepID=A0ABD1TT23_9LAMI